MMAKKKQVSLKNSKTSKMSKSSKNAASVLPALILKNSVSTSSKKQTASSSSPNSLRTSSSAISSSVVSNAPAVQPVQPVQTAQIAEIAQTTQETISLNSDRSETVQMKRKDLVVGKLAGERVVLASSDAARDMNNQSRFGTIIAGGKVQLSLLEAVYLEEKNKLTITDARGRKLTHEQLIASGKRSEKAFWVKYCVFRDLRSRGYIVKTALKFGADFRVYDRGVKPGEDHAKWIVYPVYEGGHVTWYDFSAKNRVAHSTKKRLLIAIVDEEGDVTYYEIAWTRP